MFIEFRAVKNTWSTKVTFYTVLLQIHSGTGATACKKLTY